MEIDISKVLLCLRFNQNLCFYLYIDWKKSLFVKLPLILVSILRLFICSVIFFWLIVNNLIELHEGLNELLPDLFLYFSRCTFNPEFIHLIFPQSKVVDFFEDIESDLELFNENFTQFSFIHLNSKAGFSFFLVILLQQLIKVLETNFTDLLHCIRNKMYKMFTFEQWAVIIAWSLEEKTPDSLEMLENLWHS